MSASAGETIRKRLEEAGWELTTRGRRMGTSELEYDGEGMSLLANHQPDEDALYLTLYAPDGRELMVKITYEDGLEPLLDLLVARQDELDGENYNAFVNDVVKTCPKTYGVVGDGDLVELEAD